MRRRCGDLAAEHYGAASHIAIAVANIGWHVFDGMRWKEDEDDARIRRLAHEAAIAIRDEIVVLGAYPKERERIEAGDIAKAALERMSEPDGGWSAEQKAERAAPTPAAGEAARLRRAVADRKKSRARHAKSTAGSSKLSNMTTEMRPYVLRTVQELNTLRYSVNCRSGTIDFIQEEDEESDPDDPRFRWRAVLRPHRQDDMITKLAPVDWSEEGITQAPEFRRFLHKVQPDPEIRAFLKRFFGYCLTGLTIEQSMMFFHGAGRNGKSTFMDLICHVLDDYAVTLSIDSFSGEQKRGGGEATPDLARLPGARLVSASEPEAGVKLKDALIKLLTGGAKRPVARLPRGLFGGRSAVQDRAVGQPQAAHRRRQRRHLAARAPGALGRADPEGPGRPHAAGEAAPRGGCGVRLDGRGRHRIPERGPFDPRDGGRRKPGISRGERPDRYLHPRRLRGDRGDGCVGKAARPVHGLRTLRRRRGRLQVQPGDLREALRQGDRA